MLLSISTKMITHNERCETNSHLPRASMPQVVVARRRFDWPDDVISGHTTRRKTLHFGTSASSPVHQD